MTELEKAARMALEALEGIHPGNMTPMAEEYWNKAITALRCALEQPAQQHQDWCASLTQMLLSMPPKQAPCNCKPQQPAQQWIEQERAVGYREGHQAALKQIAAQQEPVAKVYRHGRTSNGTPWHGVHWFDEGINMPDGTLLYTRPQAREPLSDAEIKRVAAKWFLSMYWPLCNTFARAIEAKLREKNSGETK